MNVLDLSFPDPRKNLEFDDELFLQAEHHAGPECLRLWESSSYFIVLGRTGQEDQEVVSETVREDGISVLRRTSGGGTVLQGPGCLNFSLVLDKERRPALRAIADSYRIILDQVLKALHCLGISAEFRPVCDLILPAGELKFSGNAQRRGRRYLLHHGTLLYDFKLPLISRYLAMPGKMPAYRMNRRHEDFITNIPASRLALVHELSLVFKDGANF